MNEHERLSLELALLYLQRPAKSFVKRARRILERVLDDETQPLDAGEIVPDFAGEVIHRRRGHVR